MNIRSALRSLIIVMPLLFCATAQGLPAFPSKPVRIITAAVGGASDFTARMLAQGLGASLGQQFIVDNRGGANGIIAAQMVAKSQPDGYNLLLFTSPIWLLPLLQDNVPYDPVRDFAPIAITDSSPSVLVVHPSLPVKSVRDLIALAKARPGELNYSRASAGGASHLSAELFKLAAGVDLLHVPYRGGAQGATELLGGHVMLMFATMSSVHAYAVSGRLRAIAVTSAKRSPAVPGVPTIAESGVPGFETVQWIAMSAPRGTPKPAIERLNAEIAAGMKSPDLRERLAGQGYQPEPSTPQQLSETVKIEFARFAKLIKAINLKDE